MATASLVAGSLQTKGVTKLLSASLPNSVTCMHILMSNSGIKESNSSNRTRTAPTGLSSSFAILSTCDEVQTLQKQ